MSNLTLFDSQALAAYAGSKPSGPLHATKVASDAGTALEKNLVALELRVTNGAIAPATGGEIKLHVATSDFDLTAEEGADCLTPELTIILETGGAANAVRHGRTINLVTALNVFAWLDAWNLSAAVTVDAKLTELL